MNTGQYNNIAKVDPDIEDVIFGKQISKFLSDQQPLVESAI